MTHAPHGPRPCPVCGSAGPRSRVFRPEFRDGLLGDGYDVVVCGACGAGFADRIPSQGELDRHYAEHSKYGFEGSGGAESPYDFGRYEAIAGQVAPHVPGPGARILDIGCATGGLLSVLKRLGFTSLLGVDPSPACASAALRLHGVDVRVLTLARLAELDGRFDLILMVGVLEHVRDVAKAVAGVAGLLAPGGALYAAVPDVEGLAGASNAPFQQFSMEHVNFFSSLSLNGLLARSGLAPTREWRSSVEWREGVTEPVLAGLYSAGAGVTPAFDGVTEASLRRYVDASRERERAIAAKIEAIVLKGDPVLVWGAGAFTRRLLATTTLGRANIVAFIDSNPHLQGEQLAGRAILRPGDIGGRTEAIVIGSGAFEREIVQVIRGRLALTNPILSLMS